MIFHLNLLHLVLVLGAAACVYFALEDVRAHRPMGPWRLVVVPACAMLPALVLLLFELAIYQSPRLLGGAFALGAAGGVAHGSTMQFKFDRNWRLLLPKSRRVLLWGSLATLVAAGLEIAGVMVGPPIGGPLRLAGAELALLCAGLLIGRALALAARLPSAPHVELRRN